MIIKLTDRSENVAAILREVCNGRTTAPEIARYNYALLHDFVNIRRDDSIYVVIADIFQQNEAPERVFRYLCEKFGDRNYW